jgi:hypothetical protein
MRGIGADHARRAGKQRGFATGSVFKKDHRSTWAPGAGWVGQVRAVPSPARVRFASMLTPLLRAFAAFAI